MTTFVVPFVSSDATLAVAGGKGANLSRLTRAGFPVPTGFLITTAAYYTFVQANDLHAQIVALASDKAKTVEDTSTAIRQLFERGRIPPEVAAAIQQAYAGLMQMTGDSSPVAVRSSATAEDLPGASFAGQQESYLNVRGEQALLEAVKRCWSSLWTARALDYRARQGIDPSSVSLAVVVQAMVPAEAAGVLFTANPMSGARDEIVLDAAWGLGEAIVGGLVTPDHIVADKTTGVIKEIVIGEKAVMTVPTATGTEEREVEAGKRRAQVLNAAQVAELVKLVTAIESHYGALQDIEWCLANSKFYIVQARPITTLPPTPVRWESPIPGAKWQKDLQAAEWVKEPPSPLGATTTFATMVSARQLARTWPPAPQQRAPWFTLINGWFYQRVDHKPVSVYAFLTGTALSFLLGNLNGHRRVQRMWPPRIALLDKLERVELSPLSDAALLTHADRLLTELGWWWMEVTWFAAVGRTCAQLMGPMQVPGVADPTALFVGNDSLLLEAERALRRAADDPSRVEAYITRFGHAVESADPIHPTLRESPELLAWQLAAARSSDAGPDERLARVGHERRAAETAVRAMKGSRGAIARRVLTVGQSYAAHTDDAVFHFQRALAAIRTTFLEAGRRLAQAGKLSQAEDVFYLKCDELWAVASASMEQLSAKVAERRASREQHKRLAPPPFIPPATDPSWANDAFFKLMPPAMITATFDRGVRQRDGKRVLVGSPSSPGRARGIARVISGPEDFGRFLKGDVLVARATSPIWTPLLGIAAAAITEVGGQFAHAAIVAREFGIPLVDGALDATRVIADGTPVVVDGSAGIVEL
jgi:pyruvate,water dikinase